MTVLTARRSLVLSSLGLTAATSVFFIIAPLLGPQIRWPQATRFIQMIVPLFVGYLGSAVHYVFSEKDQADIDLKDASGLLGYLIHGPLVVFALIIVTGISAFYWSNRPSAPDGEGMGTDTLAWILTAALAILGVTTSVAVSHVFSVARHARHHVAANSGRRPS